jgi:hypothetical protein
MATADTSKITLILLDKNLFREIKNYWRNSNNKKMSI